MNPDATPPAAQTCILVVGMHRSGTSALTRVLNLLGAELGEGLMAPAPGNPGGFWEKREVADLNDLARCAADLSGDRDYVNVALRRGGIVGIGRAVGSALEIEQPGQRTIKLGEIVVALVEGIADRIARPVIRCRANINRLLSHYAMSAVRMVESAVIRVLSAVEPSGP